MIKFYTLILLVCSPVALLAQLTDADIRRAKEGRLADDSSYVYRLPYQTGKSFLLIQAANSRMSHKQELSFDFKMKRHSAVCAARAGVVTATKADSDRGGLKEAFLNDGNHIIIRHSDGSTAYYWHLEKDGVLVAVGDTVQIGEQIGFSGNTGYTAFPHLHFQVVGEDGRELLPRFATKKGIKYLKPGRWYKTLSTSL